VESTEKDLEVVRKKLAAKEEELKAAIARGRGDKKAANAVIQSTLDEASAMKKEAGKEMKRAKELVIENEKAMSKTIQAERSYQSTRAETQKRKYAISLERERRSNDAKLRLKDVKIAAEKEKVKEHKQMVAEAVAKVTVLKNAQSEKVVELKSKERDRKRKSAEVVVKKMDGMKQQYSDELARMNEQMTGLLGQLEESQQLAAASANRYTEAEKFATKRLNKMREAFDRLNELKDDLDDAVSTYADVNALHCLCCLTFVMSSTLASQSTGSPKKDTSLGEDCFQSRTGDESWCRGNDPAYPHCC
jgi:hypothetical protein